MKALLQRIADTPFGVFGWLDLVDDAGGRLARFAVGEDDWLANAPHLSCIPAGDYVCVATERVRTGEPTYEITGVPGRSRILFHAGNTEEDTEGCILIGRAFGAREVPDEDAAGHPVRLKWDVTDSRAAFAQFLVHLEGTTTFPLDVRWAAPGSWR